MDSGKQIEAIATLDDPVRRRLYDYVVASGRAVGREEAATATATGRPLVAFHLDRLAAEGLLQVEYRRLSGRTGRGAGRPNKLYRRADRSFGVELPPRRYQLAAELMAAAIDGTGEPARLALRRVARQRGAELALEAHREGAATDPALGVAVAALMTLGFEPFVDDTAVVRLRNCPFRGLVPEHQDATCGMNLALVQGLLDGLGAEVAARRHDPQPDECCVRFPAAGAARSG